MFDIDDTKALDGGEATLYRTMLAKLLYMSAERPDCHAGMQLSSTCPARLPRPPSER